MLLMKSIISRHCKLQRRSSLKACCSKQSTGRVPLKLEAKPFPSFARPRKLELQSADEITIMENIDILASNGFGLTVDEDASYGRGEKVKLTAMPVSKGTEFGVKGQSSQPIAGGQQAQAYASFRCNPHRLGRTSLPTARPVYRSNGSM